MTIESYIGFFILLYLLSYIYYIKVSHGLGHKAQYLQLRRFFPCAVLAVLPMYLINSPLTSCFYLVDFFIGWMWIITYPLFYYLTYHKSSSDFGFHLDTVFGLYFMGWSLSLKALLVYLNIVPTITLTLVSALEFTILLIPILQWIYYQLYHTCINDEGLNLILETDYNETIEFFKSLPFFLQIFTPILAITTFAIILYCNLSFTTVTFSNNWQLPVLTAVFIFLTFYLWNFKKGVFIRTGIVELYLDVKSYIQETATYRTKLAERLQSLKVSPNNPTEEHPSTIIMIIGESASRDYMSAFTDYPKNTTPWLKEMRNSKNFLLFPNTYACKDQTVPVLEHALTEANQYNDKKFYESCSIIDIARKAGYKTYWFSNQGHVGSAETAITLVANTADKAEWTKQNLNQYQYDGALLENLKQVDPMENNFIILHLMGSHFNFINRYPHNFAKFSKPGRYDLIPNYLDSLAYTDYVLKQIFEYGKNNLNLNALVYFSDHATIPDKRRSPNFSGFANVRIPFFTYLSDKYIKNNFNIYDNLKNNQNKFFTNDLIYDFMCGIFNVTSNHYDESNSLSSLNYKHSLQSLKTNLGKIYIQDDLSKNKRSK